MKKDCPVKDKMGRKRVLTGIGSNIRKLHYKRFYR